MLNRISLSPIRPPTSASGHVLALSRVPRALAILLTAGVWGCGESQKEAEPIGAATEAVENVNALNVNALNVNALNVNALNLNALNANALNPNAMSALQSPDEVGALSRQLMKYVVSCALAAQHSFSFSWSDESGVHDETYPGLLGLATSWSRGPLDLQGQQWISACLASRINWYGVSVTISSRASHRVLDKEKASESLTFLTEEGAFWGNLFTSSPAVFTCYNPLGKAYARAHHRDCAAGHVNDDGGIQECGILHIVGSCATYCQPLDPFGSYHPKCASNLDGSLLVGSYLNNSTATSSAITVFLE